MLAEGQARELLETETLPPPATCYGALLSLVGERDRERHRGCRVTCGTVRVGAVSTVLRTLWQIKNSSIASGTGVNAGPDYQQLLSGAELVIWCSSDDEPGPEPHLEVRVLRALQDPASVHRFGGWSLGESTHLINDVALLPAARPPGPCVTFLCVAGGNTTLPVWVDHVGAAGTRYAVGVMRSISAAPAVRELPVISPLT